MLPAVAGVDRRSQTRLAAFGTSSRTRTCAGSSSPGPHRSSGTGPFWSPSRSMPTRSAARRRSDSSSCCSDSFPAALIAPFAGCSPTATRASASCSSRTSPGSCSSAQPPRASSLDADPLARLRARDRRDDREHPVSLRASRAHADARPIASRAHRGERRREQFESIALFAGPALAGLLLASRAPGRLHGHRRLVVVSTLFVLLIRVDRTERPRASSRRRRSHRRRLAGFRNPRPRSVAARPRALFTAQTFVAGAVQVFIVVMAIELLGSRRRRRRLPERGSRHRRIRRSASSRSRSRARAAQPGLHRRASSLWGLPLVVLGVWPADRARARAVRGARDR